MKLVSNILIIVLSWGRPFAKVTTEMPRVSKIRKARRKASAQAQLQRKKNRQSRAEEEETTIHAESLEAVSRRRRDVEEEDETCQEVWKKGRCDKSTSGQDTSLHANENADCISSPLDDMDSESEDEEVLFMAGDIYTVDAKYRQHHDI